MEKIDFGTNFVSVHVRAPFRELCLSDCVQNLGDGRGHPDANDTTQPRVQEREFTHGRGGTQGQQSFDPLSLPSGPITRLRAKRFKEALNGLIQQETTNVWGPNISPKKHQENITTMIMALEVSN